MKDNFVIYMESFSEEQEMVTSYHRLPHEGRLTIDFVVKTMDVQLAIDAKKHILNKVARMCKVISKDPTIVRMPLEQDQSE